MPEYYYRQANIRFGPGGISPVVRNLIIANVAVFAVQMLSDYIKFPFDAIFALSPSVIFSRGFVWQIGTYMFLHADPMHILMNMFFIWMFGTEVERAMGSKRFTQLYFISGLGAGILTCLFPPFWHSIVLGASGAAFGVMVAYGLIFPERVVLIFFVIPMRAIYMVLLMVAIETLYMVGSTKGGGIAHITHVSGALIGYLYLKYGLAMMGRTQRKMVEKRTVRSSVEEEAEQRRVDEILDKINREGMHKLSRGDRNFLHERAKRKKDN